MKREEVKIGRECRLPSRRAVVLSGLAATTVVMASPKLRMVEAKEASPQTPEPFQLAL